MTEREKFIMRAVLSYAQSNLDDLNQAFEAESCDDFEEGTLDVNGEHGPVIRESEVEQLFFTLQ